MFTAALLMVAKIWKQLKCPSIGYTRQLWWLPEGNGGRGSTKGRGGQIYGDRERLDYTGGEHRIRYTNNYRTVYLKLMFLTNVAPTNLIKYTETNK